MKCIVHKGEKVSEIVEYLKNFPEIYVVSDRKVASVAGIVKKALPKSSLRGCYFLDASEENKRMPTVLDICKWLMDNDADRDALVLAIGGGITTDMAGFAASIYRRGIRYANFPTTLLAQADAAIGGKTGVNFMNYKNMLGVISQPIFTYVCSEVLETLPRRAFISGEAELLKTFIIDNDGGNYERAVRLLSELYQSESLASCVKDHFPELVDLIGASAKIKAGIVERDEFEHGERRKLNLGHTFAHAIEHEARCAHRDITHGEAVAMGIIMAAQAAESLGGDGPAAMENIISARQDAGNHPKQGTPGKALSEKFMEDFKACGLPAGCPFGIEVLAGSMTKDKKAESDIIHFVLPYAVGDVRIIDLPVEAIVAAMRSGSRHSAAPGK